MRVAPNLRSLQGRKWKRLVDRASEASDGSPRQLAFGLLLIRLAGCLSCHPDSYRALRGCTACATQVIRRHRGDDDELAELYARAMADVELYLDDLERVRSPDADAAVGRSEAA